MAAGFGVPGCRGVGFEWEAEGWGCVVHALQGKREGILDPSPRPPPLVDVGEKSGGGGGLTPTLYP